MINIKIDKKTVIVFAIVMFLLGTFTTVLAPVVSHRAGYTCRNFWWDIHSNWKPDSG